MEQTLFYLLVIYLASNLVWSLLVIYANNGDLKVSIAFKTGLFSIVLV